MGPRRGRVPLEVVAEAWLASRGTVKRRTLETDRAIWNSYIPPRWRGRPVVLITTADVSTWIGELMARGLARSTVTRALASLRSLLGYPVADQRVAINGAAIAKVRQVA